MNTRETQSILSLYLTDTWQSCIQANRFLFPVSYYGPNKEITYSMEQSPSEANQFYVSQEIPYIQPYGSLPQSQVPATCPYPEPCPCPSSHFLKDHFNIILPSKPGSSKWYLSLRFPHQNTAYASSPPPYVLHAPPISFFSIWIPERGAQINNPLAPELFF